MPVVGPAARRAGRSTVIYQAGAAKAMQEESAGEADRAATGGESWRPPYGAVRRDVPEGLGVTAADDAVKNPEFRGSSPIKEFEKYMGEWIAVAGGGIVAHDKNPEIVLDKG